MISPAETTALTTPIETSLAPSIHSRLSGPTASPG